VAAFFFQDVLQIIMNQKLKKDIEEAFSMAQKNGIEPAEVWVGPKAFKEMSKDLSIDPDITQTDDRLFFRGMRIRVANEEITRVGITTCQFGPGVT
jgi:hypothetical protein